jgi:hypothetical protein
MRAAEPVDFSRDVLPILSANCFKCHGRDASTREAKLRLDLREHALLERTSGYAAIVPGKPDTSEVIVRITSKDEDERMPPADKGRALNSTEIETLREWIAQGASYTEHWAYVPPKRLPVPGAAGSPSRPEFNDNLHAGSQAPSEKQPHPQPNPIDAFILARLEKEKLRPAPRASNETLIRRATLDLTGLPPTPDEIDAFRADSIRNPNSAFRNLIDRLLASPHYGERWGRHWLDVARYADSGGFETDIFFGHAWRYRDYVIRAFNADKPFDRFIKEQIAGDELFPGNKEARIATGLYTTGPVLQEAGMVAGKLEYDQNTDFADTTGSAFLGLTVGCARCHDHKYDPVSQKEYFGLQAIFAASDQFDFAADGTKLRDRAALKNTQKEFEAEQSRDRAKRETDPVRRAALVRKVGDAFIDANPQLKSRIDSTRRFNLIARAVQNYQRAKSGQPADATHVDPLDADADDNNDMIALKALLLGLRSEMKERPADAALLDVGVVALLNPPPRGSSGANRRPATKVGQVSDLPKGGSQTRPTPAIIETPPPAPASEPRPPADAKVGAIAIQQPSAAATGGFGSRRTLTALKTDAEKREFLLALGQQQLELEKPAGYVENVDALRLETGEKHLNDPSPIPNRFLAHKEKVPDWHLLKRGELEMPGDVVEPGVPEQLSAGVAEAVGRASARSGLSSGSRERAEARPTPSHSFANLPADHRRSALAEWIASDKNSLTARVIANRVWQWHFGEGLVRTPNDFGIRGERPSHPELLDWLATEFIAHHWSLKHLHRVMMSSATYQMAATATPAVLERDPENRLLARFQPYRLQAEVVWDNIRAVAGTLDLKMFGLPIAPPLDDQEQLGNYRKWPVSTPEEANRRAIYILVKRSFRFPMLSAFDLPDNITSCGRRDITTVPNQALTLLNNRTTQQQAAAFAQRLLIETEGELDAVPVRAWLHAYSRAIRDDERAQALAFLRERGANKSAIAELCLAIFNTNEFIYQQ